MPSTKDVAGSSEASTIGGRYRIARTLALGGMGTVYRVLDQQNGGALALKRMRKPVSREMQALFEREYRTLAAIQHPRIIRVYDYGVENGEPFYTMELLEGRDVHELAPIPYREACRYLRDVATCLALLHTRRLVHRDIAPRNVRVTPDGHCKLLDFGALMSFGTADRLIGTPPCIPPEALRGAPLDQRADLFSFGALAYFMVAGQHAYSARELAELPALWQRRPPPPSKYVPGIPKQLDQLVLGLLQLDPAARPGSIAEAVERLTVLGSLPPEDEATQRALAESFFVHVQFVGRQTELRVLLDALAQLPRGRGSMLLVTGERGVGRTRLLHELLLQGQLSALPSVSVDAGMHRQAYGAAIAVVLQLLDLSSPARSTAQRRSALLAQLDPSFAARLEVETVAPAPEASGEWHAGVQEMLYEIVAAACHSEPLLLVIDNVEEADDASLALFAGMRALSEEVPLALLASARGQREEQQTSYSWRALVEHCRQLRLTALTSAETFELARSIFGEGPELANFAQWLQDRTAGKPLHCMELLRRLYAQRVVRYRDGLWELPLESPDAAVAGELDELLAQRLAALSPAASRLAEALAVQQGSLSRERCVALAVVESADPFVLIEELLQCDVLNETSSGYRFSHAGLRETLSRQMARERRHELHMRCAEQPLREARASGALLPRIEAGWHFLQAGEEERGARLIAEVASNTLARAAFVDIPGAAPAMEAALSVYTRQGRPLHERLPLLSALAQFGYYLNPVWGERYGEQALSAVLEVSGIGLAAQLQRYMGKTLGLSCGVAIAALRFSTLPKAQRSYPFRHVFLQLFGTVTTLTGMFATRLDGERAEGPVRALLPFAHLPSRLTPVGIYEFCSALREITRENEAHAIGVWSQLLQRFSRSDFYLALPPHVRPVFVGGLWFARGAFEALRDGRGALDAAAELDKIGLKLYRMIACQVRALYHATRGELELAHRQSRQVELHAIQFGSASQVEVWVPVAMLIAYGTMGDLVEMRRTAERIAQLAEKHPALAIYAELSQLLLDHIRYVPVGALHELAPDTPGRRAAEELIVRTQQVFAKIAPRSIIGWGLSWSFLANGLNALGRHQEAEQVCKRALAHLTPEDRPFVALFLGLEIEAAVAEAGLGADRAARAHLEELLVFHRESDNPLTRGRLHEGYARVAALSADWTTFRHHLEETRSWYRRTGTPALLARVEALGNLDPVRSAPPPPAAARPRNTTARSDSATHLDDTRDAPTVVSQEPADTTVADRSRTVSIGAKK